MAKKKIDINFRPTPVLIEMLDFYNKNKDRVNPETGATSIPKIYNNGSSRSSKTFSTIQMIYMFCDHNRGKGLYIAVLRRTLVDCRKYTFKDFVECLTMMNVLDNCEITEHPTPKIKIFGNVIEFMGLPDDNKQAPRTDICFFNEAMEIENHVPVRGFLMRCEKLAIFDWNPSYSDHWVLNGEKEFNSLFTRTSYLDNPMLSQNVVSSIESYCPWDFRDSHIEQRGRFKVRVWDKKEDERLPNDANIEAGTADRWYWLVYGEGIPAAKDGAVFNPEWIYEFPETGMDEVNFGLDFGFTNDPSVLTKVGIDRNELFVEYLTYQATKDIDTLFDLIEPKILAEEYRRKKEAGDLDIAPMIIACDSADKYRDIQFVRDLNVISMQKGYTWQFVKVKKPHITTRIALTNRFKLNVVVSTEAQKEFQNYCYSTVEGRKTNIPVDKFNHGMDSFMYCVWYFYRWRVNQNIIED